MPALSTATYRRTLFLIWFASALLLIVAGRGAIGAWQMGDPDDQLRLVQIRDWLAGQSWFDVTQYRMNPPDGGAMHWSRLVDVPIGTLILLLTPLLGGEAAELAAAVLVPLLTYGIVLWLMAAVGRRLGGQWAGIAAAVSLFAILPATIQLAPMRIDHHGWQLVTFLAATYALLDRTRPKLAAALVGICCALWMEISIEGLPFAALFIGLLGLRWLQGDQNVQLPIGVASLALTSGLLYLITEGLKQANHCDSLSPVHIAAVFVAALIVCVAHVLTARLSGKARCGARIAAGAVAGGTAVGVLLSFAPQCAGDAFAGLDPLVREYWFNRTPEGLPLWQHKPVAILQELAGLTAGLIGVAMLWRTKCDMIRRDRLVLTLLFIGSLVVATHVARAVIYPLCLGAILLAPVIAGLFARSNEASTLAKRMLPRLAAVLLLMPGLIGANLQGLLETETAGLSPDESANEAQFIALARKCQSADNIRQLNLLPAAQLMAGLDFSPGLLQFTHHKVVATGHHRNQAAMRDVIRSYTLAPAVMRDVLRQRGVKYLVACGGSYELRVYQETAPQGFWAQLNGGTNFPWLVRQPDIGPYHIWRFDPKEAVR